jgi:hypothetical protein
MSPRPHLPGSAAILGAALALHIPVIAPAQIWVLQNRDYFAPLLAETHAAHVNLLFPARSVAFPYARVPGSRVVWNIDLGKETPIVGWENRIASTHAMPTGGTGVGFWLAVGFHMVEDLNKDPSSPIIDTDYRFAAQIKFQHAPLKRWCLGFATCRVGIRLAAGHESTHLGDEFSLAAQREDPAFERVNVSYEFWDAAASFDFDFGLAGELTVRTGAVGLLKPKNGWYSPGSAANPPVLTPSHDNLELIAGGEVSREEVWSSGIPKWLFRRDVGWFVSVEARQRTVYGYHRASRDVPEDQQWSINVMAGLRPTRRFLEKGVPDLYVRWYHGVNPFGQFRSQRNFRLFGIGIHIDT